MTVSEDEMLDLVEDDRAAAKMHRPWPDRLARSR